MFCSKEKKKTTAFSAKSDVIQPEIDERSDDNNTGPAGVPVLGAIAAGVIIVLAAIAVGVYLKKRKAKRENAVGKGLNKSAHSLASVNSMDSVASMGSVASVGSMASSVNMNLNANNKQE